MTSYIGIVVYLFNIITYKIFKKSKAVKLLDMDLQTGRLDKDSVARPGLFQKLRFWDPKIEARIPNVKSENRIQLTI
jgi:amino acid permease